jgi:hypothetical protein
MQLIRRLNANASMMTDPSIASRLSRDAEKARGRG